MEEPENIQITVPDLKLVMALGKAQQEFDAVLKDSDNPYYHSKYADLASVIGATRPALLKNGLVIFQEPVLEGENAGVRTTLMHDSGAFVSNTLLLPAKATDKDGNAKLNAQTIGSAITYARRYSYLSIVGAAPEGDDDGEAVSGRPETRTAPQNQPRQIATPGPVNKAPAKEKESRPQNEQKAQPAKQADVKPLEQPTTTVESTTSEPTKPVQEAALESVSKPTQEEYNKYLSRARTLTADLSAAGLQPSRGLSVGAKLRQYFIVTAGGGKDLSDLTATEWESVLSQDAKELASKIEEAIK